MAARKKKLAAKAGRGSARKRAGARQASASRARGKPATAGRKARGAKASASAQEDLVYSDIRRSMHAALLRRFL